MPDQFRHPLRQSPGSFCFYGVVGAQICLGGDGRTDASGAAVVMASRRLAFSDEGHARFQASPRRWFASSSEAPFLLGWKKGLRLSWGVRGPAVTCWLWRIAAIALSQFLRCLGVGTSLDALPSPLVWTARASKADVPAPNRQTNPTLDRAPLAERAPRTHIPFAIVAYRRFIGALRPFLPLSLQPSIRRSDTRSACHERRDFP